MKRVVLLIIALMIYTLSYSYTKEVHRFIGTEAQKYLWHIAQYSVFESTANESPHSKFLDGTENEDRTDWIYGYGNSDGAQVPTIDLDISNFPDTVEDLLEPFLTTFLDEHMRTITHFWDSDNPDANQLMMHGMSIQPNEFSVGPVPSAFTKARRMIYGDGTPFYKKHEFVTTTSNIDVQLNDIYGIPGNLVTVACNSGAVEYRIMSIDDFLLNHNIVISQTDQWVHLSDDQFSLLRNGEENPEYEYLGRLCHLIMDMCVPTHVHNDMHAPAFEHHVITHYHWLEWTSQDCDYYEGWNEPPTGSGLSIGGYLHNTDLLDEVWESDNVFDAYGYNTIPLIPNNPPQDYIQYYFNTVNQITQMFASEDVHGNDIGCTGSANPLVSEMYNRMEYTRLNDPQLYTLLTRCAGVDGSYEEVLPVLRDYLIPMAIRATATLVDWWGTRYGYDRIEVQRVDVIGTITNTEINSSQAFVRITNMQTNEVLQSSVSESGQFSISFNNPNEIHVNLEIVCDDFHPMFFYNIPIPGHQNQSTESVTVDLGSFTLEALTRVGLFVGRSGNSSFQTIEAAVRYALDHDVNRIQIAGGPYSEKFMIYLPVSGFDSLELCGSTDTSDQTEITSWGNNTCHVIDVSGLYHLGNLTLRNLVINGDNRTGGIKLSSNIDEVLIEDCTIKNCAGGSLLENYNGIAIQSYSPTIIRRCKIFDNVGYYSGEPGLWDNNGVYHNSLGVIELASNSTIEYCDIYNNRAATAGAVNLLGQNHLLSYNKIYNNRSLDPESDVLAVRCFETSETHITNNVFFDNGCDPSHLTNGAVIWMGGSTNQPIPSAIANNTFINESDLVPTDLRAIRLEGTANVQIQNNVLSNFPKAITNNSQFASDQIIKSNLFWDNATDFTGSIYNTSLNLGNCIFGSDPQLDANYVPLWNATTMSHCIDTGTGVNDDDKTPPDIGAFRATDHRYWQYRFRSGENDRSDTYHWVSYPVVNSLTEGKSDADVFFKELLGKHVELVNGAYQWKPDVLQEILWYVNNSEQKIYWSGTGWGQYIDTHSVVSPQGYKVKLLSVDNSGLPPTTVELHHSGFLTPDNTPFMVYGSASNGVQTYENWIGYFDTDSVWPTDAFASIWNDITMIKAKDWCLYRDPNSGVGALIGKMLPINCGDMVIVSTVNDHEFQWNTTVPTDPKKKEVPTAFEYVEKADYTPVYIDLSAVDLSNLKEIGLKLDGICKGAVVVTDSLEQICAYLEDGENLSSGLVELVFFYESKSQPMEMRSVAINDKQLSSNMIGGDSAYPVYNIKVSTADLSNTVVPVLSLEQNYPNPFNPTTSIRYSIEEPGSVSLDIYNIKGQLVKTLYNGNAEVGSHTAIWNGLDNSGNACSSGVYFYRLRTPKTSLVRKMLMLK